MAGPSSLIPDSAGGRALHHYRIVVLGALDPDWAERLGLSLTVRHDRAGDAVSEFAGALPDQAALMGVLQRLYSYGAELISVERAPWIVPDTAPGLPR